MRRIGRGRTGAGVTLVVAACTIAALLAAPTAQSSAAGTRGKVAGLSISSATRPEGVVAAELDRIAALGVNFVSLDVWLAVGNRNDHQPRAVPGVTADDAVLAALMQQAHRRGLNVALVMKLRLLDDTWRGAYDPANHDAFFSAWARLAQRYGRLLAKNHGDLLVVGSEMSRTERHHAGWRYVLGSARHAFPGKLAYNVNFDGAFHRVSFWSASDFISVSAYFPISAARRPSVDELVAGWHGHEGRNTVAELEALSARWGKPVLFGEVGYLASTYPGKRPWGGHPEEDVYAPELQAAAYQALLRTFEPKSWWAGVLWWKWHPMGNWRNIADRPAERLLHRWYAKNERPPGPAPETRRDPSAVYVPGI